MSLFLPHSPSLPKFVESMEVPLPADLRLGALPCGGTCQDVQGKENNVA